MFRLPLCQICARCAALLDQTALVFGILDQVAGERTRVPPAALALGGDRVLAADIGGKFVPQLLHETF